MRRTVSSGGLLRQLARSSYPSNRSPCLLCQHGLSKSATPPVPSRRHASTYSTPSPSQVDSSSSPQRESFAPQTHYDIFPQTLPLGPPPATPFQIDLPTLRREFLQLQSKTHPDKFPVGPQKARAAGLSSRINEAYKTLTSPLLRAQYVLSLHGVDVTSESQGTQNQDPDTLMQVLEVQERLEEGDVEEEEVEQMRRENDGRAAQSVKVLGSLIERGQWEDAGKECARLNYWMNVKEGLNDWEKGKGGMVLVH